jgi:anion transporter
MPDSSITAGSIDRSTGTGMAPSAWQKPVGIALMLLLIGLGVSLPSGIETPARLALFAFGAATIFWATTRIEAGYVALGAVLFMSLSGAIEQDELFETLESEVVWLMIGAFIVGAAAEETGLARRIGLLAARRIKTVGGMMWLTGAVLVPLTFLIPSTSGRAAVMLPMFRSLTGAAALPAATRALALLIPVVILVSTIASITGAGSHLIVVDLLDEAADMKVSFLHWMLWGTPFAIAAAALSIWVINRQFLTAADRARPVQVERDVDSPLSEAEKLVLAVFGGMIALWSTESVHGLEIATVSVLGAFVICMPQVGATTWKKGMKAVSWSLVIFVGAALVLGEALIETGAAQWIVARMFDLTGIGENASQLAILAALSIIVLTSHLYMTSHAARTAALVPPLLYLALQLKLDPVAMAFLATVGINYCITLPVSSKALLVFQEMDEQGRMPADLARLSTVLMPAHFALMILFYYGYWQHVGLAF